MLLQEDKEHGCNEATESHEVIPLQRLTLEENNGEDRENGNRDDLLDDLELHQRKGSAVANEAHTVCRHLTSVLEERQEPTDKDNDVERCVV